MKMVLMSMVHLPPIALAESTSFCDFPLTHVVRKSTEL